MPPIVTRTKIGALLETTSGSIASNANASDFTGWVSGNVVYDTSSFWSSGAAERLTIPAGQGGLYRVVCMIVYVSTGATGVCQAAVRHLDSGGTIQYGMTLGNKHASANTPHTLLSMDACVAAVAGDYFLVRVQQNSGATRAATIQFGLLRLGD